MVTWLVQLGFCHILWKLLAYCGNYAPGSHLYWHKMLLHNLLFIKTTALSSYSTFGSWEKDSKRDTCMRGEEMTANNDCLYSRVKGSATDIVRLNHGALIDSLETILSQVYLALADNMLLPSVDWIQLLHSCWWTDKWSLKNCSLLSACFWISVRFHKGVI